MTVKSLTIVAAAATLFITAPSFARDCADGLIGDWTTNIGATMRFEHIDAETGMLSGHYFPASDPDTSFPLTGFINPDSKDGTKALYPLAISIAVSFGKFGGITNWSGTCIMTDGKPVIKTEDLVIFPMSDRSWAHVGTSHDTLIPDHQFTRKEPPTMLDGIDLSDWAAIAVAIAAFGLAMFQGKWQREHDRLSVRPYLELTSYTQPEEIDGQKYLTFYIEIQNIGLGPAIIKEAQVRFAGNETNFFLIGEQLFKDVQDAKFYGALIHGQHAIAAGDKLRVCRYGVPANIALDGYYFADKLQPLEVSAPYSSLYDNEKISFKHKGKDFLTTRTQVPKKAAPSDLC